MYWEAESLGVAANCCVLGTIKKIGRARSGEHAERAWEALRHQVTL